MAGNCGQLFAYALQADLGELYQLLPASHIRIHILSDQARIQRLPWEYMGFPGLAPGHPALERSVVRIVPTRGRPAPAPRKLGETIRVLFVSAAPRDQNEVDFETVKGAIRRAFESELPERFTIEVLDGATRESFRKAIAESDFDILHFSGHGSVDEKGHGRLLLVHRKTGKTDPVTSEQLATLLSGREIRLVILSACDSSTGDFD